MGKGKINYFTLISRQADCCKQELNDNIHSSEINSESDVIYKNLKKDYFTPVDRENLLELSQKLNRLNILCRDIKTKIHSYNNDFFKLSESELQKCAENIVKIIECISLFPKYENFSIYCDDIYNSTNEHKKSAADTIKLGCDILTYDVLNTFTECFVICCDIADLCKMIIIKNT